MEKTENGSIYRPKTRGELLEKLKQGVRCEVVASNEEITSILLDGWLKFEGKYKTYPSENDGWVIYEAVSPMTDEQMIIDLYERNKQLGIILGNTVCLEEKQRIAGCIAYNNETIDCINFKIGIHNH